MQERSEAETVTGIRRNCQKYKNWKNRKKMIFFINNTNSHRRGRHGKGIILFTQKIHLKNEKKNIND